MIKKSLFYLFAISLFLFFASGQVAAETVSVTVSDNGSGSDNTINQTVSQTTNIEQNNTANVSNNIDQNLNTGQNTTNSNTGEQNSIATGEITSNTEIANTINNNVVNSPDCGCNQAVLIENSGNGANSQNTINSSINNQTEISVANWAEVTNNVQLTANSGWNLANDNSGSVQIVTGNITVAGQIKNSGNTSLIEIDPAGVGNINIFNRFNGAYSTNLLNIEIENLLNIYKYDFAVVNNNVDIIVNTGNNVANGNNGDVLISTGDIDIRFAINNDFNHDFVRVGIPRGGVPPTEEPPQPAAPAPPSGPTAAVSQAAAAAAAAGQILAAAALPVTGPAHFVFLVLFWLTLAGIGLFLRRISGLSPPNFSLLSIS